MRCHWRQGLLWPQLEPAKRTKASTARNLQPANSHDPPQSRNCFRSLQHPGLPPVPPLSRRRIPRPLHPFGRRTAVTPILGGLHLRGSKRHRQLKTAKQKPRKQTKSQRGGNLYLKKSRQGCHRDFAHHRGRIFRLLRAALVPSKPKVQSAHSKSSSSSRTTVSGVSRHHQSGDQSPKLPGSTCKSSSWS